jgi:ParB-like chromosome segregation protein Spo0J
MEEKKLEVVYKNIDEVIPYINNPRHNEAAIDKVAASIKEFGFKVPIVIDRENVIVTGHTRREAAKRLKMENIPCIYADDLTPAQVKAFRLADNKVSEYASWDDDLLKLEFDALTDMGVDLGITGFESDEIDSLLNVDEIVEEDEEKPEVEFTEELNEESNYLVLYFDNSIDWLQAQSVFDLKTVKALDSKAGYKKIGIGRVINGTEFIRKVLNDNEN